MKNNYFFFALFSLIISNHKVFSQKKWQNIHLDVFSNLTDIQRVNDKIYILGEHEVIKFDNFKLDTIIHFSDDLKARKMFVLDSINIYVTTNSPYQKSDIWYWNGKKWQKKYNPVANTISTFTFIDDDNAIFASYGELVLLKNNQWQHLSVPTGNSIIKTAVINLDNFYMLNQTGELFHYYRQKWKKILIQKPVKDIIVSGKIIYLLGNDFVAKIQNEQLKTINISKQWKKISNIYISNNQEIYGFNRHTIFQYQPEKNKIKTIFHKENVAFNALLKYKQNIFTVGYIGVIYCYTDSIIPQSKYNYWKGFTNINFHSEAKLTDDEYGVVAADFNNDGYTDLFTCGLFEEDHLYINQKGSFTDKAKEYHVNILDKKSNLLDLGACAGDIDNDGYIDLYISVLNGKNKLLKNINGKYFVDYSEISNTAGKEKDRTNGVIFGDIDNDGDLDIFVLNEFTTNHLYLNNGAGIFSEITKTSGLNTSKGGNSATFGDIDNDGDIDLYVTNWSKPNILYQNMWKETGKRYFKNITTKSGTAGENFSKSNACVFADINNDTKLDLFVTNRKSSNKLYINKGKNIFEDKTSELIGIDSLETYGAVIADFNTDGNKDIYISNVGSNKLYLFENQKFKDETLRYGGNIKGYSTGSALIDFDNNGLWDIYVANYLGASSTLSKNNKFNKRYVKLKFDLMQNNKFGIGSKVFAYLSNKDTLIYYDEIRSGSGYVSMNSTDQIIYIPRDKSIDIKIIFPNGKEKILKNLSSTQQIIVRDTKGFKHFKALIIRYFTNILKNPYNLLNLLKIILVLIVLVLFKRFLTYVIRLNKYKIWLILIALFLFFEIQNWYFLYHKFIFAHVLPVSSFLIIVLLTYYYFMVKFNKQKALIKQREIKHKLAQNLHDDLASTINSIKFYLAFIKQKLNKNEDELLQFVDKSESLVQNASDSITDLVWGINPKPETLENIIFRIKTNFNTILHTKNIKLTINIKNAENQQFKDKRKQNIYLILKESINNILKYADATEIEINSEIANKKLKITISDNGKGFDLNKAKHKGNGLTNMQDRATEIKGELFILTQRNSGTKIMFVIPLK